MKVKAQNSKLQFLSQLRKHLKSPGLNQILNPRRHQRRKTKPKTKQSKHFQTTLQSSARDFRINTIKRAGEKLKLGFKRKWKSDVVAQRQKNLFEYALNRNKVVTASRVVSTDDIEKSSNSNEYDQSGTTYCSSSSEAKTPASVKAFTSKEYYLDCSSTEFSPKSLPDHDEANLGKGHNDSISNQVVSDPVESSNTSPALDFQPAHCSSVDIGVQCFEEACFPELTTVLRLKQLQNSIKDLPVGGGVEPETYPAAWVETGVNQSCSTSTKDDQLKSPSTSNVSEKATKILEEMAKFLQKQSCSNTPTHPDSQVVLPSSKHFSISTHRCQLTAVQEQESFQQSYSANWLATKSVLNDLSNTSREFSSENISSTRSNLLSHYSPNRANKRLAKKTTIRYLYQISSDSDSSDDEILLRIKRKVLHDDAMTEKFFTSRNRCSSTSRISFQHLAFDSDSSFDSPYSKPFFRH